MWGFLGVFFCGVAWRGWKWKSICVGVYVLCDTSQSVTEVRFNITVYSTYFNYSYMTSDMWHRTIQPVFHDWCNKGRGMCFPVCGMVHIK